MTDLSRLRAVAEKATPGPWEYESRENWIFAGRADGGAPILEVQARSKYVGVDMRTANAEFVAACDPTTILTLLSRVEKAEAGTTGGPRDAADIVFIADLIRNEYDKAPAHYAKGDEWNDGCSEIAQKIIQRFRSKAEVGMPTREQIDAAVTNAFARGDGGLVDSISMVEAIMDLIPPSEGMADARRGALETESK